MEVLITLCFLFKDESKKCPIFVRKSYKNMGLQIEFTNKEITPWSGMILMKKLVEKTRIISILNQCDLPQQGSNRGHSPLQLIQQFWLSVWCGASKFEHLEVTRQDNVLKEVFEFTRMAGSRSFGRYFNKFDLAKNQHVFDQLYGNFFSQINRTNITLDFDSSILTRYGQQEGAKKGYNLKKPGRNSHHPIMAFVPELEMVANFWLRSGNSTSSNNFISFLENTLSRLENKTVGLIRADSGFYELDILNYLEKREHPINYIIACKFYKPLQRHIANIEKWWPIGNGVEIADTQYQSDSWDRTRRLVVVRQSIAKKPKATGRTLKLFEDEVQYKNYRYACYVTNLSLAPELISRTYRDRANAENQIKELKYDFSLDSFNLNSFYATEAALNFVMMAYNLMSLFKKTIIKGQSSQRLKTIRYKLFAMGGYIVKNGNQRIIKLALAMKQRKWFTSLWESSQNLDLANEHF